MATTFTPRSKSYLGAGLVLEAGQYDTDGTTAATFAAGSGAVYFLGFSDASLNDLDPGSTPAVTLSAKTLSGGVTNITVTPSGGAVVAGSYVLLRGGS